MTDDFAREWLIAKRLERPITTVGLAWGADCVFLARQLAKARAGLREALEILEQVNNVHTHDSPTRELKMERLRALLPPEE